MSQPLPFDPIAEARRQWERNWGPGPAPAMSAVMSVMRVQQILNARLNDLLAPFGLTFARYEALMLIFLSRAGSLPLGKISARLQVHRTSVTNLIDGLEAAGYARRSPHVTDRRTVLAEITPAGTEAAEAATATLNEQRFGTTPLSPDELLAVTDLFQAFRAKIDGFPES